MAEPARTTSTAPTWGLGPWSALARHLAPYRTQLLQGFGLLVLTNALDKTIPWLLKRAIDALSAHDLRIVRNTAFIVVTCAVSNAAIRVFSRVRVFNVGRDVEFDLRAE